MSLTCGVPVLMNSAEAAQASLASSPADCTTSYSLLTFLTVVSFFSLRGFSASRSLFREASETSMSPSSSLTWSLACSRSSLSFSIASSFFSRASRTLVLSACRASFMAPLFSNSSSKAFWRAAFSSSAVLETSSSLATAIRSFWMCLRTSSAARFSAMRLSCTSLRCLSSSSFFSCSSFRFLSISSCCLFFASSIFLCCSSFACFCASATSTRFLPCSKPSVHSWEIRCRCGPVLSSSCFTISSSSALAASKVSRAAVRTFWITLLIESAALSCTFCCALLCSAS
mmetsp:Transcript_53744/g.121288  ORF Transcript_53744/g.121288 Transcript_53744/m.121288 type:complete len:286 (+) Transcript_53744:1088-1945(+)